MDVVGRIYDRRSIFQDKIKRVMYEKLYATLYHQHN